MFEHSGSLGNGSVPSGSPSQSASFGQAPPEDDVELVGGTPLLDVEPELEDVPEGTPLVLEPEELELVVVPSPSPSPDEEPEEVELEFGFAGQSAKSQTGTPLPTQINGGFRSQLPPKGGQPSWQILGCGQSSPVQYGSGAQRPEESGGLPSGHE